MKWPDITTATEDEERLCYYIDTGTSFKELLKRIYQDHPEDYAHRLYLLFNKLVRQGRLTMGNTGFSKNWVVVTHWNPNTAKKMNDRND